MTDSPKFSAIVSCANSMGWSAPALDVALDQARLGHDGDVGRIAALDRGGEHRGQRVARGVVADVDVRVLLVEAGDDLLEGGLLGTGPGAHDRDLAGDVSASVAPARIGGTGVSASFIVVVAAAGGREDGEEEHEHQR